MAFGLGGPKTFTAARRESRTPMEVGVQIIGHPGTARDGNYFHRKCEPEGCESIERPPLEAE